MARPKLRRAVFIRPPVAASCLKFNGAYWRADYRDFAEWFLRRAMNTMHSTKQIEDAIGWALEADPLIASILGNLAAPATRSRAVGLGARRALSGARDLDAQ